MQQRNHDGKWGDPSGILLNGQWAAFAAYLADKSLTMAAQPQPARTHDAKPSALSEAA